MKFIGDYNIENKKVILRCDLNVTIKDNKIIDNTKIKESLKTIEYLISNNCSIVILSHLGKIKSEEDKKKNSLEIVKLELEKLLNKKIYFSKTTRGTELTKLTETLKSQEIVLIENTRYEDYPNKLESNCDEELAKYWASLGDLFVQDAFGTTHRKHASNYGISKYLDTYYGFLMKKEIDGLAPVLNPQRPFTVIMGGAKVEDKISLITHILSKCDYLIVGGGIANTFLKSLNYEIGTSIYDQKYLEEIKDIYIKEKSKIILPTKVKVLNNNNVYMRNIDEIETEDNILDIEITDEYINALEKSQTIFVNGTMGLYENPNFSNGTKEILNILKNSKGKVIIGGGDALASVNKLADPKYYNFISTGGGATLEYIKEEKLQALEGE